MKKQHADVDDIYDLFAIRIIIDTPIKNEKADCWLAYSIVTDMYTANTARLKDWISNPKSNGYESLHITVYGPQSKWVEVQIRTKRMDEVAERGLAAHWKYKGIKSEGSIDNWMNNIRDILETSNTPTEFMRDVNMDIYNDEVKFNGERLKGEEKVYIVMNKPKGFVTTASDPHADKTVMDLMKGCNARVFPVGRLDKNTTGVLMFTNDGEIAEKLTHPSYDKKKIYQVTLDKDLKQEDYDRITSGIELSDGLISADELEYIDDTDHRKLGIEIHSGKNRIVRRIFESLGYNVKALDRVYFAGLTKKGLKRGAWRYLTTGEVNVLKMGAYV